MAKTTWTRRERVLTALEHREPDRVPMSMSITIDAYNNLKQHLGLEIQEDLSPGHWTDVPIHPLVADKFGLDIHWFRLGSAGRKATRPSSERIQIDEWGIEWTKVERPSGGYYFEMSRHPLADATIADLDDYPWPDPYDPTRIEGLRERLRRGLKEVRDNTDFAILAKFGGAVFETAWYLRGMERFFLDMLENPSFVHALFRKIYDVQRGLDDVGLEAAGEYVDILRLSGEDLGTQRGPLISLKMFRSMVRPYLEPLWSFAKEKLQQKNPRAKIMLHSCGAVTSFIPDWIDMGLDMLDPIQPFAAGMDPFELKAHFGAVLSFHGGIDAQHVLPAGSELEVREHTRRYIQALAPGGGYIVAPVHNVQGDVPARNLIAMRDAVLEYGQYPIRA
jgi:uroporphyrinogen decarboxylase